MTLKPERVREVLAALKRRADYEFLFAKLSSADWALPLAEAGLFREPPAPVRDGDTIRFPFWPESNYLARVAEQAPADVAEILLAIPRTQNARVHEDIVDAALAMPGEQSARLALNEVQWIEDESHLYFLLPEKLSALIEHLLASGQVDAAFQVARVLFAVLPDPRAGERAFHPQPQARIDDWDYGTLLYGLIDKLSAASPTEALDLLSDLLEQAVRIHCHGTEGEDYSFIWQRDLEQWSSHERGVEHALAVATTRASVSLARRRLRELRAIVETLERRPFSIFRRIALLTLARAADDALPMARQRLLNHDLFDNPSVLNEYAALQERWFGSLPKDDQQTILAWIATGRDRERMRERHQEMGYSPTQEDLNQWVEQWQRDRLAPLQSHLSGSWRQRFDRFVEAHGPPVFDRHSNSPIQTRWGSESPKSADEMRRMSVSEIVEYLRSWKPAGRDTFNEPTRAGLATVLAGAVAERPEEFTRELTAFLDASPYYFARVLEAVRGAVRQGHAIEWRITLASLSAAISMPSWHQSVETEEGGYTENTSQWIRCSAAALIEEGLSSETSSPSFDLRLQIWSILELLSLDPDPTVESESRDDGALRDALTVSINTVRGRALHAVVQYALWVRQRLKIIDSTTRLADFAPEVVSTLEMHLDLESDASISMRAVYGQRFPWLVLLDAEWSRQLAPIVFPAGGTVTSYWYAAWSAYVRYNRLYDSVFFVLMPQYSLAIERIGDEPDSRNAERLDFALAEHLMVAVWRGLLEHKGQPGLLKSFFRTARAELRGHAIEFVGRSLMDSDGTPPVDVLARVERLWAWRRSAAEAAEDRAESAREVVHFGSWVGADCLRPEWRLENLEWVLRYAGEVEPAFVVLEKLPGLAKHDLVRALRCARLLVLGQSEYAPYMTNRDSLRLLAAEARQSSDPHVRSELETLTNGLMARGYFDARFLFSG